MAFPAPKKPPAQDPEEAQLAAILNNPNVPEYLKAAARAYWTKKHGAALATGKPMAAVGATPWDPSWQFQRDEDMPDGQEPPGELYPVKKDPAWGPGQPYVDGQGRIFVVESGVVKFLGSDPFYNQQGQLAGVGRKPNGDPFPSSTLTEFAQRGWSRPPQGTISPGGLPAAARAPGPADPRAAIKNDPNQPSPWWQDLREQEIGRPGPRDNELQGARDRFKDVWSDDAEMLEYLQRRARGADSLVEREAQQAHNQLLTDQASQLASMRGGYNPAAARQAQYLAAQNSQKLAGDTYTNKLREQQLAQDAYLRAVAAKQGLAANMFGQESGSLGREQQHDLARRELGLKALQTGLGYEKMHGDRDIAWAQTNNSAEAARRAQEQREAEAGWGKAKDIFGMVGSVVQGAAPLASKVYDHYKESSARDRNSYMSDAADWFGGEWKP